MYNVMYIIPTSPYFKVEYELYKHFIVVSKLHLVYCLHTHSWFHLGNLIRGGSLVIIMKGGHDEMKGRCGFYSKLEYCEGVVEELGRKLES